MRGAGFLMVFAVVGTLISGCGATPLASPLSSSPPVSESATATAMSTRPSLAFGGNCASAFTESDVSKAVGEPVTLSIPTPFADTWSVQQLGGIYCSWADSSNQDLLWITVIPASSAGVQVAKQNAGQPYCYGGDVTAGQSDSCSFGTLIGSWWFAGVAYTAAGSHLHSVDAIASLTSALTARLAEKDPRAIPPQPGTWSAAVSCDAVATSADLATVLGDPALRGGDGNGGGELGPGVYGALAATGYRSCVWDDGANVGPNAFTVEIIPGAAWVLTQGGLENSRAVKVVGAVSAVEAPVPGASVTYLYISDGTNLMILEPNASQDASSLSSAVVPLIRALAA